MKLNIHVISHPIIKNLSEVIVHHKTHGHTTNHKKRNFGLLIMYEAIRDWLKIYSLHVKQLRSKQPITIIDPKESCVIILNSMQYFNYFCELDNLLPRIQFKLVSTDGISETSKDYAFNDINQYTKVIIALHQLNSEYVINLTECLIKKSGIRIDQIRLISILCREDELIKLSQTYKRLRIYTSRIT